MVNCHNCALFGNCSYEPHSQVCQEMRECFFCPDKEKGDYIYEQNTWDGGVSYDWIRMDFCPVCGRELNEEL